MSLTKIGSIGINTGIQFAGVTTVSTLHVGSGVTLSSDGDVFATGVCTATTFSGSGASLTNLPAANITGTLPAISGANLTSLPAQATIANNSDNRVITGGSGVNLNGEANLTFDGSTLSLTGNLKLPDNTSGNASVYLGTGDDFYMNHNGTNSFIINSTGNLYIRDLDGDVHIQGKDAEESIIAKADGAVELYYDNSKKLQTQSGGVRVFGDLENHNDDFIAKDDCKFAAGNSEDIQLYHDGSNSYVKAISGGTGDLYIFADGKTIYLRPKSGEDGVKIIPDGAVELYHNNTKRVETSAYGTKFPNGRIELPDESGHQFQLGASGDFTMEHDGSNTYLKNITGDTVLQNDAAVEITASSGGTKRFRFDSDGLKFGSDTAAANALDDYEEGTWTPVIKSGNDTISYSGGSPTFRYTKIGNMVYVNFTSGGTTTSGTTGGDFSIQGLPFTSISGSRHIGSIINNWGSGMQLTSNFVYAHVNYSTTTVHPYSKSASSSGGNYGHVQVTAVGSSTHMQWSIVYQAA